MWDRNGPAVSKAPKYSFSTLSSSALIATTLQTTCGRPIIMKDDAKETLNGNPFSAINQQRSYDQLDNQGFTCISGFIPPSICEDFIRHYKDDDRYRSTINMSQYHFGEGQYRYFKYPFPSPLGKLRQQCYDFLLPIARRWATALKDKSIYPDAYTTYLQQCHQAGQSRPTPLILKYQEGDYNCLHQDKYGEWIFPLQMIIMLSAPKRDFSGGELIITEQRPRMQSRAHALVPDQGDAVIFGVDKRPQLGTRGYYRINMKHGVSTLKSGCRYTLGIILHDAR